MQFIFNAVTASLTVSKDDFPVKKQAFEMIECETNKMHELRFAEITAAVSDVLLDDETSPSDSLISSTASDDMINLKQTKKKINSTIKVITDAENDINSTSLMFDVLSPVSHGSPNHASHSFSLSDGDVGRDFLIDDEIADQPVLCIGDEARGKRNNNLFLFRRHSKEIFSIFVSASNSQLHTISDSQTMKDIEQSAPKSATYLINYSSNNNSYAPQPKPRVSMLSRKESLDTLSPCESICSDDLMMDFDCESSLDSADQASKHSQQQNDSQVDIDGINIDVDEKQLWNEFEAKGSGLFKDWSYLLSTSRNKKRDISM